MPFTDLFAKKPVVSLEVFPPKPDMPFTVINGTLEKLGGLRPAYVSVTYGAGGSGASHTADVAKLVPKLCGCPALGHLTCVAATRESALDALSAFSARGIEAVLALRGDIPQGMDAGAAFPAFHYAYELVSLIKTHTRLSVGAACYPEGHYQSLSLDEDLRRLKHKVDCGVDFLITQLFFDNTAFYAFLDNTRKAGIDVPVSAGLMPVLNAPQILRMTTMCGSSIPAKLSKVFAKYANDPDSFLKAGMDFCCEQIRDLIGHGIDDFHIYTMNRPKSTAEILYRTGLRDREE